MVEGQRILDKDHAGVGPGTGAPAQGNLERGAVVRHGEGETRAVHAKDAGGDSVGVGGNPVDLLEDARRGHIGQAHAASVAVGLFC